MASSPTVRKHDGSSLSSKKNRARKKKRKLSKHVLKAQEERREQQQEEDDGSSPNVQLPFSKSSAATKNERRNKGSAVKVKDPSEAAAYLRDWKQSQDATESTWKFNKNTQSWLIRHQYEPDKVSKASFALLLEYLQGLHSDEAKSRIRAEATRRVLRYKQYEKSQQLNDEDNEHDESPTAKGGDGAKEEDEAETKRPNSADASSSQAVNMNDDDEARWNTLDAHGKRKKYKRARKVLEDLKVL